MTERDNAYLRHQQSRWLRPDSSRWVRQDIERFLVPATKRHDAILALAMKYNDAQPRVPQGHGRESGRWTSRTSGGAANIFASPMGEGGASEGDAVEESEGLFDVTLAESDNSDLVQLAGDPPRGIGDNGGPPLEQPEIPTERPATGGPLMRFIRAGAAWVGQMGRNAAAVDVFYGMLKQIDETNAILNTIKSATDPAKTLEELQERVGLPTDSGYEDHHIVNQHDGNRSLFGDEAIDSFSNQARIAVLKHIEISRWYARNNPDYGGLSPRDYLRDKSWDEQMQVGLDIMRKNGVLK